MPVPFILPSSPFCFLLWNESSDGCAAAEYKRAATQAKCALLLSKIKKQTTTTKKNCQKLAGCFVVLLKTWVNLHTFCSCSVSIGSRYRFTLEMALLIALPLGLGNTASNSLTECLARCFNCCSASTLQWWKQGNWVIGERQKQRVGEILQAP